MRKGMRNRKFVLCGLGYELKGEVQKTLTNKLYPISSVYTHQ